MLSFSFRFGFQVFESFTSSAFFPSFLCLFCFLLSLFLVCLFGHLFLWQRHFLFKREWFCFQLCLWLQFYYTLWIVCALSSFIILLSFIFFLEKIFIGFFFLSFFSFCPFLSVFVSVPLNFYFICFLHFISQSSDFWLSFLFVQTFLWQRHFLLKCQCFVSMSVSCLLLVSMFPGSLMLMLIKKKKKLVHAD